MKKPRSVSDQQGMVAIITTMILMIVISLIVMGFSQVVRRNQRQALDTQLSSQAFYAAESGLNYARKLVTADPTFTQNTCVPPSGTVPDEYSLDGQDTKVTCLLIQPVNDIQFSNVGSDSRTAIIDPIDNGAIGNIYINWESTVGDRNQPPVCTVNGSLPTAEEWRNDCDQPLLRVDLVPISETNINRDTLIGQQYTAFLYPTTSSSPSVSSGIVPSKGTIVQSPCSVTVSDTGDKRKKCMIQLNGAGSSMYAIRIMSIYGNSNVSIHVEGNPQLVGAQVLADSTGRSVDVVKRVQARIPVGGGNVPNFAVNSNQGACKIYQVIAGVADSNACNAIEPEEPIE